MNQSFDFRRLVSRDNNILQLLVVTALIFALMSFLEPNKFLRYYNFESISFVFPELGILAIAMMLAMLTGGIDLSVIGIANLSGILAGCISRDTCRRKRVRAASRRSCASGRASSSRSWSGSWRASSTAF